MTERAETNHNKILQSFKRSLNEYHANAVIQAEIANSLMDYFEQNCPTDKFSHVLEFGCSTGLLSEQLLSRLSIAEFTANDLIEESHDFIAPLLDKAGCNWQFKAGTIETIDLSEHYNLIASASTMQWVFDTHTLLKRLSNALAPGGWLLLSTFAGNHFAELQLIGSKARATRYTNLDDWPALIPDDLIIKMVHQEEKKIHFPTVRALLAHLRQTGVNGNAGQTWTRKKLIKFETEYEARFKDKQGIYLTYAPVYFIAQKRSNHSI